MADVRRKVERGLHPSLLSHEKLCPRASRLCSPWSFKLQTQIKVLLGAGTANINKYAMIAKRILKIQVISKLPWGQQNGSAGKGSRLANKPGELGLIIQPHVR